MGEILGSEKKGSLFNLFCIAGLKFHFLFVLVHDSQSPCQNEGITQAFQMGTCGSEWESHFPKAAHLESGWGRPPTRLFQHQGGKPSPSLPFSAWTSSCLERGWTEAEMVTRESLGLLRGDTEVKCATPYLQIIS